MLSNLQGKPWLDERKWQVFLISRNNVYRCPNERRRVWPTRSAGRASRWCQWSSICSSCRPSTSPSSSRRCRPWSTRNTNTATSCTIPYRFVPSSILSTFSFYRHNRSHKKLMSVELNKTTAIVRIDFERFEIIARIQSQPFWKRGCFRVWYLTDEFVMDFLFKGQH